MTLRGHRVILRRPREQDKADRLACGRDPEATRMYGGDWRNLAPLTLDEVERWYQHAVGTPHAWMIEVDGRCVGEARLHRVDETNRGARYAIGIFDRNLWSRGLGAEVTRLILHYAFETLWLHRVELITLEYNHRAIACFERCGFVREGIERDSALVAGEWHSDIRMSILEDEYRALAPDWRLPTDK